MKETYKLYICYDHTIDGSIGTVSEFHAESDVMASAMGSKEFGDDRNYRFGILVRTGECGDVIVCN